MPLCALQVGVASHRVTRWLLSNDHMSLVVQSGVGTTLTSAQLSAAQKLYNFFLLYVTSADVTRVSGGPPAAANVAAVHGMSKPSPTTCCHDLQGMVQYLSQCMETWVIAVQSVCPPNNPKSLGVSVQRLRMLASSLRAKDVSAANAIVLLSTSADLNRFLSTTPHTTQQLQGVWLEYKSAILQLVRHLKVGGRESCLHGCMAGWHAVHTGSNL